MKFEIRRSYSYRTRERQLAPRRSIVPPAFGSLGALTPSVENAGLLSHRPYRDEPRRAQQSKAIRGQSKFQRAFTLLEVLVTVGSMALLLGLLLPGLGQARDQAKAAVCRSNIVQLALANDMYAGDFGGTYAAGAPEIVKKNLKRWHGARNKTSEPFDGARGPLAPYFGADAKIRACPTFVPDQPGFECGCGGYGYNNAYVGIQMVKVSKGCYQVVTDLAGTPMHRIRRPAETLMFSDTAFLSGSLMEYSFAEPRFHPAYETRADPSIHFRHMGHANVAWCDGHVSGEARTYTSWSGLYEGDPNRANLGWFGHADDNGYFDLD